MLDKAEYSAFQSTLNSPIVSYRIVPNNQWTFCKKKQNLDQFCGFVGRSRAKKLSASGGTPHQGLCPQTPIIGSRSTCSPWDVPLPNNFSESAPAFLPGRGEIGSGLDWLVAELSNLFQGQTHPGPRPHTWSTLFHLDAAVHAQPVSTTVHLTSRHHLTVPRYRWNWFGGRAFSVGSPTTWNALSDDLLRDPSHSVGDFHQISVSSAIEMSH